MDFFEKFVIPSNANHLALHSYILVIALMLFIPYVCMLMGSATLSIFFNRTGWRINNKTFLRFSRDIIKKLGIRNAHIALGIIPLLSILLSYIQLTSGARSIALSIMTLSAFLLVISFVLIYRYKNTLRFGTVFDSVKLAAGEEKVESSEEFRSLERDVKETRSATGLIGWFMLVAGVYLLSGSFALIITPDRWHSTGNILQLMFSWPTLLYFLFFVFASGLITGAGILFYFYIWNGGVRERTPEYDKVIRNTSMTLAIISGIFLPVVMILNMTYLPPWVFSPGFYLWALIGLVTVLLVTIMLYYSIKRSDTRFAAVIFVMTLLVFLFNILKDQAVFAHAINEQTEIILKKGEDYEKEKKSKVVSTSNINGEEIYNQKCTACHKFDQKVVGPAHKDVVPKYNGDVAKLSAFILNPTKIDLAYPPMPNPGLKPKEAQAVAEYLIKNIGK